MNDPWRTILRHDIAEAVKPIVCKPATLELQAELDAAIRKVWAEFVKKALLEVSDVVGIEQRKAQRAAGYALVPDEPIARILGADGRPRRLEDLD